MGVSVVIDFGLVKISIEHQLTPVWTAKHYVMQRWGRAGRTRSGRFRELHAAMRLVLEPEMKRKDLDSVVLGVLRMGEWPPHFLSFALDPP